MKFLFSTLTIVSYNLFFLILDFCLPFLSIKIFNIQLFSEKKRAFYFGRKKCFQEIKKNDYGVFRSKETTVIWFHCSSLGEFEQSKPLIKKIKNFLPKNKIAVTFFSPSGFLTAKTNTLIDWIGYIPLDTPRKINLLIKFINPKVLILSKNDFWPNLLHLLKNKSIPVVSISSKFRKNDFFWKLWAGWFYDGLKSIDHFYTSDYSSKKILNQNKIYNVTVSGDLRIDRVLNIFNEEKKIDKIDHFINNENCWIAGSTWNEDYPLFMDYVNAKISPKVIIAPHDTSEKSILLITKKLKCSHELWSNYSFESRNDVKVLILDKIGILKHVYRYGDWAYVGGGMGNLGLHNILEAGVFKIPIIIGKNYEKFPEAIDLIEKGGCFSVSSKSTFEKTVSTISNKSNFFGMKNFNYIKANKGSVTKIFGGLKKYL